MKIERISRVTSSHPDRTRTTSINKLINATADLVLFLSDNTMKPKLVLTPLQHPRGYYRTNITVGRPPLPGGWDTEEGAALPGPHCLKHYAAFYRDDIMVARSCLQIWPTWMYDLR